jgi:chromatin remodeling complex protein RSC6
MEEDMRVIYVSSSDSESESDYSVITETSDPDDFIYNTSNPLDGDSVYCLSEKLCSMLGYNVTTNMMKSDVGTDIRNYIIRNRLQDDANKHIINLDSKFKSLLNTDDDIRYVYNIANNISGHLFNKIVDKDMS